MSRDFAKNSYSKKTASYGNGKNNRIKTQTPPWFWLALGIAVGLLIAAVMYLKVHPLQLKGITFLKREAKLTHESHRSSHSHSFSPDHNQAQTQAQSQIAKNTEPQPQFDFYNILPKMQVGAADSENALASTNVNNTSQVDKPKLISPAANLSNSNPLAKPFSPGLQLSAPQLSAPQLSPSQLSRQKIAHPANHILQVAAFRHFKDADKLRAELTLLGFNVMIKPIAVHAHTWNRVWVGPFENQKAIIIAKQQLAEHKLKGIMVK